MKKFLQQPHTEYREIQAYETPVGALSHLIAAPSNMDAIGPVKRVTQLQNAEHDLTCLEKFVTTLMHRRVFRGNVRPTVAALLTLALCLSVNTSSAFGQTTVPGNPADPTRTIIALHLDATTGAITVGNTTFPGQTGMHVLALRRQPQLPPLPQDMPAVIEDSVFTDAGSLTQFLDGLRNDPGTRDALIIMNGVGNYGFFVADVAASLGNFGGQADLEGVNISTPFIFIGNGGLGKGGAFQRGGSTRPVDGYLTPDSNRNYKFIQPDYISYDITTDGTIKIGTKTYTAANAQRRIINNRDICDSAASNSLHLLIVDRESPDTVITDRVYCTGADLSYAGTLAIDLRPEVVTNENLLVFIASNGKPVGPTLSFGATGDMNMTALGVAIDLLGGYYETLIYMGTNDTFSFVGAAPPSSQANVLRPRSRAREASSVYPDHPTGEMHGVLARGRGNWYSPLNAESTGTINFAMYGILAMQPTPFPHPVATNQAEMTAFQNISTSLCKLNPSAACPTNWNIRDQYSSAVAAIADYYTALTAMREPGTNADCSNPANAALAFCVVRQQVLTELFAVSSINALEHSLDLLLTDIGVNDALGLQASSNDIEANFPNLSPAASVPNPTLAAVSYALGQAGHLPVIGPIFGVVDAMINYGISSTTDTSGNQTVSLNSSVAAVAKQTQDQFTQQKAGLGTQFDLIRQDWGKLQTLGTNLGTATFGTPWYWDTVTTEAQILQGLSPAFNVSFYQSLMSSIYAIGLYKPACPPLGFPAPCNGVSWAQFPIFLQPANYWAYKITASPPSVSYRHPFLGYAQYTYPGDTAFASTDISPTQTLFADNGWQGISLQSTPPEGDVNGLYDPPGQSVMSGLFTPISKGGMGVYRAEFFEGWPFPHVTCADSTVGCHWAAAAPALEAVQRPAAKLTFSVHFTPQNSSRQNVQLIVHNSGTKDLTSVQLNNISVRTLAGQGNANLQEPRFPIQLGSLKKGAFAKLTLDIVLPPNVQKIELAETGVAQTGEKAPYAFNLSQTVAIP